MRKAILAVVVLNLLATAALFLLLFTPGSLERLGVKDRKETPEPIDRHLRDLLGVNTMLYDYTPKPGQAHGKWCLYQFRDGVRRRAYIASFPSEGQRTHRLELEWEPATGRWMLWDGKSGLGGNDAFWKELTSPVFSRQPGDEGRTATIDGMEVVAWAISKTNHDGKTPGADTVFDGIPNRRKYMAAIVVKTFKNTDEAEAFEFPE